MTWALFATGVLSLYVGREAGGVDVRRARRARVRARGVPGVEAAARVGANRSSLGWDDRTGAGLAALSWSLALVSGWVWSSGGDIVFGGYNLLGWHMILGTLLVVVVLLHALLRRKPLRRRDVRARRRVPGRRRRGARRVRVVAAAEAVQHGARIARRQAALHRVVRARFVRGQRGFPPTSWVADRPADVTEPLRVVGLVAQPLSLALRSWTRATSSTRVLDCTSGWYSRRRWRGVRLDRLLARAGVRAGARHIRVESHRLPLELPARRGRLACCVATHVGDEPLPHGHGAPARLVAPGRRGFHWVKWVVRIELIEDEDHGAPASTVWSSATPQAAARA